MTVNVPSIEERKAIFDYLLRAGFSQREAENFDCMGIAYKIAVKAMHYEKLKAAKTTVVLGGLHG